ncbi:hypothetical protein J4G37_19175 [Microvirga sp. 3-52]|nr:hypothetical protein [Microvirga sp. 3-52]
MIVTASGRRGTMLSAVSFQFLGVIVIAWAFLVPIPLTFQVLIALLVTFIRLAVSHIQTAITMARKEAEASSWFNVLVFRIALNKALTNDRRGEVLQGHVLGLAGLPDRIRLVHGCRHRMTHGCLLGPVQQATESGLSPRCHLGQRGWHQASWSSS